MVYLDYSATTPVNKEVLDSYNRTCIDYIGNPNSLHKLGLESKKLMNVATKQVSELLGVKENEIIWTSGSSESNNLAIFGTVNRFPNRGKHIITTKLEHSSVIEPLKYLEEKGYIIDYVSLNPDGSINLNHFKSLINNDTVLVTICEVNSEIGIIQNINEIGNIIKNYPKCFFHVDGTQTFGKKRINLNNVDMYSLSGHKIYGLKGIGVLVKKEDVEIKPIIMGGKSQTVYRSGTPALPLIVSMAKAMKLMNENLDKKINDVKKLRDYLMDELNKIEGIKINSNDNCVPHIVNISLIDVKPETMLHSLEQDDIYISTKTACSNDDISDSVMALTNDEVLARTSIRISISHLTTLEELKFFVISLKVKLVLLKELKHE